MRGIVLFLAGMEAQVLQEQHLAVAQAPSPGFHSRANAVRSERHGAAQQFAQALGYRGQG